MFVDPGLDTREKVHRKLGHLLRFGWGDNPGDVVDCLTAFLSEAVKLRDYVRI
jgi:hypothetical protein